MMVNLLGWLLLFGVLACALYVFNQYLDRKVASSKLLMVASTDFFENAEKLFKTPEDLPDRVLNAVELMTRTINNREGSRALLYVLKRANGDLGASRTDEADFRKEIGSMRPELQIIFGHLTAAWMNYVSNRSFFYQFAISTQFKRMAAKNKTLNIDDEDTALWALPRMSRHIAC